MIILLIRHGATKGNREGRYVGSTDEELLEEAVVTLQKQRDRNHVLLSQVEMVAVQSHETVPAHSVPFVSGSETACGGSFPGM